MRAKSKKITLGDSSGLFKRKAKKSKYTRITIKFWSTFLPIFALNTGISVSNG